MADDKNPYPELTPAFSFSVKIGDGGNPPDSSFQEVSGIRAEVTVEEVPEGGENGFVHRFPKSVKYPNLVLKRGIAPDSSSLVDWCKKVFEGDFRTAIETRRVEVHLLDEARQPIRSWGFRDAYPVIWEVNPFNATKNEIAIEKIELHYSYLERIK